MNNSPERAPERILTRDEVMEAISRFAEGATFIREMSDGEGLYFLEAEVKGKNAGEKTEYLYTRRGNFPNVVETVTCISAVYYEGGASVFGEQIAVQNETGEWEEVK